MDRSTRDNPDRRPLLESGNYPEPPSPTAFDIATLLAVSIYIVAFVWLFVMIVTI